MRQAEGGAEWAGLRLFHVTQVLPESKCREAPLRPRSAPRGVRHRRRRGSLESESLANLPHTHPFFSLRPVPSSVKGDDNVFLHAGGVRTGRDDAHDALGTQPEQDGSFTVRQAAKT